jgi:hypothetical protein
VLGQTRAGFGCGVTLTPHPQTKKQINISPLHVFPQWHILDLLDMESKNKILELVAAEDKNLARLAAQKRAHKCRTSAFENALVAINGDKSPAILAAKRNLESKIALEIRSERDVELKITDVQTRKAAYQELIVIGEEKPKKEIKAKPSTTIVPGVPASKSFKDLNPKRELYQVREFIRQAGKPLFLNEIVSLLGYGNDKGKFNSLRGTIFAYAKERRFFTVESKSPHVIGLLEFKNK